MFYLPTKQNRHPSSEDPTLPHHHRTQGTPLPTGLYGPYHGFTPCPRPRCHTHHCRPRVLPERHIPTLFYVYHRGGDRPTISRTRISMVWAPTETNHRPRPPLHITLREGVNHAPGHPTEPIHGLSPSNRWVIRTKEPMGGTIPPFSHV